MAQCKWCGDEWAGDLNLKSKFWPNDSCCFNNDCKKREGAQ